VAGADYADAAFGYRRSHLWRNFGIITGMFIFFVCLTAIGMESQKPNKGGGAVTIFKRGQVPKSVEKDMETQKPSDEESGKTEPGAVNEKQGNEGSDDKLGGVAKNETIFTFQNITYTIPYEKGERTLLKDVQGYVTTNGVVLHVY
jgi:hypothetical protein